MGYQWLPSAKEPLTVETYSSQIASPSLQGFQAETSTHSHKELSFTFDCNAKTAISSNKLSGGLVEYLCAIDIGVYPMSPQDLADDQNKTLEKTYVEGAGASYELSYEIDGIHTLLYSNHLTVCKVPPLEEKLYQFNVHEHSVEGDSLAFIIQMAFGSVEVKVSKTERNPCHPTNATNVYSQAASNNHFATLKFGKGGFGLPSLEGSYYICVKSLDLAASLLLMPSPNLGTNSLFSNLGGSVLHLPPNHNMIGEISDTSSNLQFSFNLNLDPKQDEIVTINVSPIKGHALFRITATTSGFEPNSNQTYWNVVGNSLAISSKDPTFKPKAEYRVKISVPYGNEYKVAGAHRFMVSYSVGAKDVLLAEGLPYLGQLTPKKSEFKFRIRVPPSSKNLTILKSYIDNPYKVDGYLKGNSTYTFNISYSQGGYLFDETMLRNFCPELAFKECNIYLKAFSEKPNCTYLVSYSVNNRPFVLHHNYGYFLPQSPTMDVYKMYFIYHISSIKRDKNFTLDCENPYSNIRCYVKFVNDGTDFSFPTATSFTKVLLGEFASVDIGPANYENNNVMLVTVDLIPSFQVHEIILKSLHIYAFTLKGSIRVSAGPRKLLPGKPYKGKLRENAWKHFLIHHSTSENIVINFESSFSSCRLYVSKGHNAKVTVGKHLVSSMAFSEKNVVINPSMLATGESIIGYYTMGVQCFSNSTYRLMYKPSASENYEIRLNELTTLEFTPDEKQYVEFLNYGPIADFEISFRSTKADVNLYVKVSDPIAIDKNDTSKDKEEQSPSLPSDENFDFGTDWEFSMRGTGKITVEKNDPKYCQYCRFIVLVKVSEADKVDLLIRKSTPEWPTPIFDGEEQFSVLNANETAYYVVEAMRLQEAVSALISLQFGNLEISSSSYNFSGVASSAMSTDVLKGYNKQTTLYDMPADRFTPAKMYLYFKALEYSRFTVNFAENNVHQHIEPTVPYRAVLGGGNTKVYTMSTQDVEAVQVLFRVSSLSTKAPSNIDDEEARLAISKGMVKVFQADSDIDVIMGRYFEVPTHLRIDRDVNRFELKFIPSKKISVIKIKNPQPYEIHYEIEFGTRLLTYTKQGETVVSALHPFIPFQVYSIPVRHERSTLKLEVHECVEHLVVRSAYRPSGRSSESGAIMFDKYIDKRTMELNEGEGVLELTFMIQDAFEDTNRPSFFPPKAKDIKYPSVFSFSYTLENNDDKEAITSDRFKIRSEDGTIQVHDLDGGVSVKKVVVDDLDGLLNNHNMKITYTLILTRKAGLLNHLIHCGKYALADAKQYHGSDDYHTFTVEDHVTFFSVVEERRKAASSQYFRTPGSDQIKITPSMTAWGDRYEAAVIAKILVYGKQVVFTYAGLEHLPRRPAVHAAV